MSVNFKTSILKIFMALLLLSAHTVKSMILKQKHFNHSHSNNYNSRDNHQNRKQSRWLKIKNYHPPRLLIALSGFISGVITNVHSERKLAKAIHPSLSMSLEKQRKLYSKVYNYNMRNFGIKKSSSPVRALFVHSFTEGQKYALANDDAKKLLAKNFDKSEMKDILAYLGFTQLNSKDKLLMEKTMNDIRGKKHQIEALVAG